jgi:hypothetical protein
MGSELPRLSQGGIRRRSFNMNWYEYPAWGAIGVIGCTLIRAIYGLLLARMALRNGQPVTMGSFGGYQLGEAAVTQKPTISPQISDPELNDTLREFKNSNPEVLGKYYRPKV